MFVRAPAFVKFPERARKLQLHYIETVEHIKYRVPAYVNILYERCVWKIQHHLT